MKINRWTENLLRDAVSKSNNKSETLRNLGLNSFTGNYDTLNRYIRKYNIDISHFKRNGNIKNFKIKQKKPLNEILISGSTFANTSYLKHRLYNEGLKERKCELCGQDENWNGKQMSLILDHINGINNDNRIINLRIVCPNCNATLPTHCGKNVKDKRKKKVVYRIKKRNYCSCGKEIQFNSKLCISCNSKKNRKTKRPNKDELFNLIKNKISWTKMGKMFGVSDNAVRKWAKSYHII